MLAWLAEEAIHLPLDEWLAALGGALRERGVDVAHIELRVPASHPAFSWFLHRWTPEGGVSSEQLPHNAHTGEDVPSEALQLGLPIHNHDPGRIVFAARASFTAEDKALLGSLRPAIVLVAQRDAAVSAKDSLLSAYLGPVAAQRVLKGVFAKGEGEHLNCAIAVFRLEGYASLTDREDADTAVLILEAYLTAIIEPLLDNKGFVIELSGDRVLAVFPLADEATLRAQSALTAARQALKASDAIAQSGLHPDGAQSGLRVAVALHVGEVLYGTVGARWRMSFTVVGKAVNEVYRVVQLAHQLDCGLLLTGPFRDAATLTDAAFAGAHRLPGTPVVREIYTTSDQAARSFRGQDGVDADDAQVTMLAGLVAGDRAHGGAARLFAEGLLFTGVAIFLAMRLAQEVAGFVSVCLVAAGLAFRLNALLLENRDNIYVHLVDGWVANRKTAAGLSALFAGMVVAYAVATLLAGQEGVSAAFSHVLTVTGAGEDSIVGRRFGAFSGLLMHNALVLVAFFILAFVYWTYGALIAIAWNACAWGVTLTVLVVRGFDDPTLGFGDVAWASVRVIPHLALEGVAYVFASLAAIFQSKAIAKYSVRDPLFARVTKAALTMIVIAFVALAVAAASEAYVAG